MDDMSEFLNPRGMLYRSLIDQYWIEIENSNFYYILATIFKKRGYTNFYNLFVRQGEEEYFHARKFFKLLVSKGIEIDSIKRLDVVPKYEKIEELVYLSLRKEKENTNNIYKIREMYMEIGKYDKEISNTLAWFISEQYEEEEKFGEIVRIVKNFGIDNAEKEDYVIRAGLKKVMEKNQ